MSSADSANVTATAAAPSEPSPPRVPMTLSEGIKLVGGLIVVSPGLLVLLVIAVTAIVMVSEEPSQVVAIAASAFGVIGTVVGAYFGLKIGSDGAQTAVAGMRDEAAKAQAFAAHVPEGLAESAISDAQTMSGGPQPAPTPPPRRRS